MALPPISDRDLSVLIQEVKNLRSTSKKVRDLAKDTQLEGAFAGDLQKIDEAIETIEDEVTRRTTTP